MNTMGPILSLSVIYERTQKCKPILKNYTIFIENVSNEKYVFQQGDCAIDVIILRRRKIKLKILRNNSSTELSHVNQGRILSHVKKQKQEK